MKRAIVWSQLALVDLKNQTSYIARRNPDAARRVSKRIRASGRRLGDMALGRAGRVDGSYEKVVAGLPYILVYSIDDTEGLRSVRILRVLHGAQDWPPGRSDDGEEVD